MVLVALGLTVLGFAFLVAAVASGQIFWAWACIVVGAVGLIVLVIDLIRGRGRSFDEDDQASVDSEEAYPAGESSTNSSSSEANR